MTSATDDQLLARARRGDEAAFEALVRRHAGALLSVARVFLAVDQAGEAVRAGFLAALERPQGEPFPAHLRRHVAQAAIARVRERLAGGEPLGSVLPPPA